MYCDPPPPLYLLARMATVRRKIDSAPLLPQPLISYTSSYSILHIYDNEILI